VCASGCGTTASANITIMGFASCQFDGGTTALNYVVVSTTAAGKCSDGGSTFPAGVTVIGKVQSTNVGAGTYPITVFLNDVASATSGGNGRGTTVTINGSNVASNNGNFNDTTPVATAGNKLVTWQKTNGNPSTISAQVSASGLIDVLGSTQGQILYRSASAWTVLSPGTSGQFLETLGAGADPTWASPPLGTTDYAGTSSTGNVAITALSATGVGTFTPTFYSAGNGTPSIVTCGTGSPSVSGTDARGIITTGSGASTACTLNFSTTLASVPICVAVGGPTAPAVALTITSTTSAAVIFGYTSGTSRNINYHCAF
jgi:hypothetical protein